MKKNQRIFFLILIFLLTLFLRVYKLNYFISYHQDQVRDLFYVKDYFDKKELILLGPKASVGNFYLPPFWYYLMTVAYFFSPSPLAPAFLVAFLNSLAVIFLYLFGKKFFSEKVAFFSSLLYAFSPLAIEYSRFAWNPNPIILFTILTFYFLYQFIFKKNNLAFILGTITANLAFQLHYQGTIIFLFFFFTLVFLKKINLKKLLIYFSLNLFLILPFIIYEFKNNFSNISGIFDFIKNNPSSNLKFFGIPFFVKFIIFGFSQFLAKVLFFKNSFLGFLSLLGLSYLLLREIIFWQKIKKQEKIIIAFFVFSFVMFFVYKNSLIDFYLLFLIPLIVFYFALFLSKLNNKLSLFFITIVIIFNFLFSSIYQDFDKAYIWSKKVVETLSKTKNYCLKYQISKENFIEDKLKYLFSIAKNKPRKNCDEKTTIFYLCQDSLCDKNIIKNSQLIKVSSYEHIVNIFKLK